MSTAASGHALIVQNKGGGHGEIGFHLAKALHTKGIPVTILQETCKTSQQPFASYGQLEREGVSIVTCKVSESSASDLLGTLGDKSFDFVIDNNSKDASGCQSLVELAKTWGSKQYIYVSSAGMYKGTIPVPKSAGPQEGEMPIIESDEVNEDNGCRTVEVFLGQAGIPWTSFRPQVCAVR
jgi:nucleoside-diphosphate-sugar epimerase